MNSTLHIKEGKSYDNYDNSIPDIPFVLTDKQIIYYDESPKFLNNRDNFTSVVNILDAIPDNIRDNEITFNGYVSLWYVRGKEAAEKFVISSLEYFKPTRTLWSINNQWYTEELRNMLESRY